MNSFRPGMLARVAGALLFVAVVSAGGPASAQTGFVAKAPKPGFGAVYIGRPFGWHTSVFALPMQLDGKPLGGLGPNQFMRIEVRAGRHTVDVPDSFWTRAISGNPHPVKFDVRAGGSYYLTPTRWATNPRTSFTMVGSVVVPMQTADRHASFAVASGKPPEAFAGLTQTPVGQ